MTHTNSSSEKLKSVSKEVRREILKMIYHGKSSHIGSAYSMTDILVALYFHILNISPDTVLDPNRDRFILSKGHGCAGLYATLAVRGYFEKSILAGYYQNGGLLAGHPVKDSVPGIEASTGSLGHGLSIATGLALTLKGISRVFVLMGDGECNEGSIWEAAMFSSHYKLNNLIVFVDANKLQGLGTTDQVMKIEPLTDKWAAFGWNVKRIDGHNFEEILSSVNYTGFNDKPTAIIADTIKGKGVSFMENILAWHYKSPTEEQFLQALEEIVQ